jgi:hypothetical protein
LELIAAAVRAAILAGAIAARDEPASSQFCIGSGADAEHCYGELQILASHGVVKV